MSSSREYLSVNSIAITDQILCVSIDATSLNQLLCSPGSGWMVGYIAMQYPATVITQNDQNKQDFEAGSWNGQKIK
jgi:hypothetical protein